MNDAPQPGRKLVVATGTSDCRIIPPATCNCGAYHPADRFQAIIRITVDVTIGGEHGRLPSSIAHDHLVGRN